MVGLISLFCSIVLFVILQCVHVGICIIHECQTTKKVVQVTDLILYIIYSILQVDYVKIHLR